MPAADANKRNLRLPRELAGRLKRAATIQGISENDYVILALRGQLDADEARRQQRPETRGRDGGRDRAPRGLGINLAPPVKEPAFVPVEPAAPVVVQVTAGTVPPAADSLIEGLAAHIKAGPSWERNRRRLAALEVIKSARSTPAARCEAEQKLEAAMQPDARTSLLGDLFRT